MEMTDDMRDSLQSLADLGGLDPAAVKAHGELKQMKAELAGFRGRREAAHFAVSVAEDITNCTVADVERLTRFFYDFMAGKESGDATGHCDIHKVREEFDRFEPRRTDSRPG